MRTIPQEHGASLRGGYSTHGLPAAVPALLAPAIEARDSARPWWRESRTQPRGQSAGSDPSHVRRLRWHLHGPLVPPETTGAWLATVPSWLEALWAFRGAVLYDQGRRPQFQIADGRLADMASTLGLVPAPVTWAPAEEPDDIAGGLVGHDWLQSTTAQNT